MDSDWLNKIKDDAEQEEDYWEQSNKDGGFSFELEDDPEANVSVPVARSSVAPVRAVPSTSRPAPRIVKPEPVIVDHNEPVYSLKLQFGNEDVKSYSKNFKALINAEQKQRQFDQSLTVAQMINLVINGQHQYCYFIKAKEHKLKLLDAAIEHGDGDTIISALLFLEQTMSPKLFNYEISKRTAAVDHYVTYLRSFGPARQNELVDFLTMLGRYEEAAMTKLRQALSTSNTQTKIKNLRSCKQNHFDGFVGSGFGDTFAFWGTQIADHVALLERQLPIEDEDNRIASRPRTEANEKFFLVPRQPLPNQSVITTLLYCCLYHYDLTTENFLAAPVAIRKVHNLTEKQFLWTALEALSMRKAWPLVDALFEGKSWLGGKKIKSAINFIDIARVLHRHGAPSEKLAKYVNLIEDEQGRLLFARENNLQELFVDLCISMKNRRELTGYLPKLHSNEAVLHKAQYALRSPSIKWKN